MTGVTEKGKRREGIEVEVLYHKENCAENGEGKIQFNYVESSLPDDAKIHVKKDATYLQPQIKLIMSDGTNETLCIQYPTDIDNVLDALREGQKSKHDEMMFTWWRATNEKKEGVFIHVFFKNKEKNVILNIESDDTLVVEFSQASANQIIKSLVE